METDTLIDYPKSPALDNAFYTSEIPAFIRKIKNDCGWKMGDLKSVVIKNDPDLKVVLTAMHPETLIESRQRGRAVVFHVIEGSLRIQIGRHSTTLVNNQKFTLYDEAKYKIEALEQSIFLFVIFPSEKRS